MAAQGGYEEWYRSVRGDDRDEDERREATLQRWFARYHRDHGPADREEVEGAFLADELELAGRNVAVVMGDIERSTGRHPDVAVDRYLGAVRISFNGNFTTPSASEWENPDALVEVAGYLQEHMIDDTGIWPLCPTHDGQVLIPEVERGVAVWRCRTGGHDAAPIGQLGR